MNEIGWGIIGCGDVARKRVAAAIQADPNSRLIAACRRDQAKLADFCSQFNVEHAYQSAADLINNTDIGAVYIATPVSEHVGQTLLAAKAGKHVLVEKPMASTIDECKQMIDQCQRQSVTLGVAYYRRFYPVMDRIEELLKANEIGAPLSVSVVTGTPIMQPTDEGYWRSDPQLAGGGALMDIGSHRLNLLIHLFGKISSVKGHCSNIDVSYKAENVASVAVQFESGVLANVLTMFGTPSDPDEFTIIGTKGRLTCTPLNGGELKIQVGAEIRTESLPPADNFNAPLITDFVAAIHEKRDPKVSGKEGLDTNDLMERAYIDAGRL